MEVKVEGEVIVDTLTNKLMKGAKGQTLFRKGSAGKSARHSYWYKRYEREEAAINAGHTRLVQEVRELEEEYNQQRNKNGVTKVDEHLWKKYGEVEQRFNELFSYQIHQNNRVRHKSIPFKENTRFKVMKIVSAEVEEV